MTTYHLPPTRVRKETVVKYSVLSVDEGHRSVAATYNGTTEMYSVMVLIAPFADASWEIESITSGLSEFGATSEFRTYEQRG